MMPMSELITLLALLALGFVFGRMWHIRQEEIRQRSRELDAGFKIPTARLPMPLDGSL